MSDTTSPSRSETGRTHEPGLRELTAQLDGLRELIDERDRLYSERSTTIREEIKTAFASSEKAITKSEASQQVYNTGHNDLTRKMEAQYSMMVPREEARLKWDAVDKELQSLRESRSGGQGEREASRLNRDFEKWVIGVIALIAGWVANHFWK